MHAAPTGDRLLHEPSHRCHVAHIDLGRDRTVHTNRRRDTLLEVQLTIREDDLRTLGSDVSSNRSADTGRTTSNECDLPRHARCHRCRRCHLGVPF